MTFFLGLIVLMVLLGICMLIGAFSDIVFTACLIALHCTLIWCACSILGEMAISVYRSWKR